MGRKFKYGFDYFPMDVDMFYDLKVRKLINRHGAGAVSVYTLLLCTIYKDGYYINVDEDISFVFSEVLHCEEKFVSDVLSSCLSLGLLDSDAYRKWHIYTSVAIQQRYRTICAQAKRRNSISEFSVLHDSSAENTIYSEEIAINSGNSSINKPQRRASSTTEKNISSEEITVDSEQKELIPNISESITISSEDKNNEAQTPENLSSKETVISSEEIPVNSERFQNNGETSEETVINSGFGTQRKEKKIYKEEIKTKKKIINSEYMEMSVHDCVAEMKADEAWREQVVMNRRADGYIYFTLEALDNMLDDFERAQKERKRSSASRRDIYEHFLNWLNLQLQKLRRNGNNGFHKTQAAVEGAASIGLLNKPQANSTISAPKVIRL